MYLLDTNVVSELRKEGSGRADRNVVRWISQAPAAQFYLSVITLMELEVGVLLMERRDPLQGGLFRRWFTHRVHSAFVGRVYPIDEAVARQCAALHVPNKRPDNDALIAATALVHGLTVVTRNVVDFETTGVPILNPWEQQAPRL